MRETWYGDKRDLLKWSTVLQLAHKHSIDSVLHVAMLTDSDQHEFSIDGISHPLSADVWKHFRCLGNMRELCQSPLLHIFDEKFSNVGRSHYFANVLATLNTLEGKRLIVLDPDTGIALSKPKKEHVLPRECRLLWDEFRTGDILLIYQHAWRHIGWREVTVQRIAEALGDAKLFVARADKLAGDVILIGAQK